MKTAINDQINEFSRLPNYRVPGSRAVEIIPEPKTMYYSPWKWKEMAKFTSFVDFQITVYRGLRAVEIVPGAKNRAI